MKTAIQPLFKWTGSKQRMLAQYAPHFFPQENFTRFVDLFAGGLTNSYGYMRSIHILTTC